MRHDNSDKTIERNYLHKYRFLIGEYEQLKQKSHPTLRLAKDFYLFHGIKEQGFLKYYNRFKQTGVEASLLPQKRGAKYKARRIDVNIEEKVLEHRKKGLNKYEIYDILKPELLERTPSHSCLYQVFKRNGLNVLKPVEIEEKRRYIREKAGDLAHIDCHYLSKNLIANDPKRYYLVSVVDDQSRIAWCELVENIKSLTVMFCVLRCFNQLKHHYGVEFKEVLTDNGSEFGSKATLSKEDHPFERLLIELGIKHRHTMPYRPQTNGKVERFWRTLNDDLIEGTHFETKEEFKDELFKYLVYYNTIRPHQGLNGLQPEKAIAK
jgi:Integrase core domain